MAAQLVALYQGVLVLVRLDMSHQHLVAVLPAVDAIIHRSVPPRSIRPTA